MNKLLLPFIGLMLYGTPRSGYLMGPRPHTGLQAIGPRNEQCHISQLMTVQSVNCEVIGMGQSIYDCKPTAVELKTKQIELLRATTVSVHWDKMYPVRSSVWSFLT